MRHHDPNDHSVANAVAGSRTAKGRKGSPREMRGFRALRDWSLRLPDACSAMDAGLANRRIRRLRAAARRLSGSAGVDAVVTPSVLATSRPSVSARSIGRTGPSAMPNVRAGGDERVALSPRVETRIRTHTRAGIVSADAADHSSLLDLTWDGSVQARVRRGRVTLSQACSRCTAPASPDRRLPRRPTSAYADTARPIATVTPAAKDKASRLDPVGAALAELQQLVRRPPYMSIASW